MTVTESDVEQERQPTGNAVEVEDDNDFYNARARDSHDSSSGNTLPDTERVQEALAGWGNRTRSVLIGLWDGSFWDEQPPSPRELLERYRESPWTHSEYGLLKIFRKIGLVISIAWSVPLYGLAIIGQRFGRALTTALITYLFIHLI